MNVTLVRDQEHREAVDRLLTGALALVRIFALNVSDIQLIRDRLGRRLRSLRATDCTVTVAFGENLWNKTFTGPRDKKSFECLKFLEMLSANGVKVYWVRHPLLHAKVIYTEELMNGGNRVPRVLVTSANVTETAVGGSNLELGVVLEEPSDPLMAVLRKFFERVISAGRGLENVV